MKLWRYGLAAMLISFGAAADGHDPITQDPAAINESHPPAMAELNFMSHGARMNGHIYMANGPGPHPTVILLHGFPGNEKNLDLAQAMRRAGFNVLFFHYRGAWGSDGDFLFSHVVEDVAAAAGFLRSERAHTELRVDADRLSLVGHSMGGFAALMAGAKDERLVCTVGLAAANLGWVTPSVNDPEELAGFAAYTDSLTMLKGPGGEAVVKEMAEDRDGFDTRNVAPQFAGRPVLLIAARGDKVLPPPVFHDPVVEAYRAQGDIRLTDMVLEGDHSFSWTRLRLARELIGWLGTNCR